MTSKNDLHAFPITEEVYPNDSGLTMRDYFAAKAMQAYMQWALDEPPRENDDSQIVAARYARVGYQIADAMIEARGK